MTVASASAVGPPPGMKVRLSSNESPFGPSPVAIATAREAVADAHRYPDDQSAALRGAIAAHEALPLEQVTVGTGSTGLLMDAVAHVCSDGDEVLAFEHSFIVYRLAAHNARARYVEAPIGGPATAAGEGYARDVEALLDRVGANTRLVVVDNPGNPTGAHLTGDELRWLVERLPGDVTIVVDEAYHQFAVGQRGYATVAELGIEHPRLLTVRTFSKAHALAGMRIGYLTGPAALVAEIDARRARFNVTAPAQAAAIASLSDVEHLDATVQGTIAGRDRMSEGLRALGVAFTSGLGNFVTIELGTAAPAVVERYAAHGIGTRPLAPYGMLEQLRVSVGTDPEVEAFLSASDEILPASSSRR